MRRLIWIFLAGMLLGGVCHAGEINREDLGRDVRLRILVDKTMQPTNGWVAEPWMIEEAREAGFNVYVPRKNHDDLHNVKRVAYWCKRRGMFYMPWMRGSLRAGSDVPDAKKMVWANGLVDRLWSPNSDEFWEWTRKYIVEYAKISAKNEHFVGVFLDYENYAAGPNCYELSYDETILKKFAEARDIDLPELAPDERKEWLVDQKLHEPFERFQVDHWRQRCRALREAVDEYNPAFRFCVYPAPGTKFMRDAIYPEWSTEKAPLILADAVTYGRPSRMAPQKEAVHTNRRRLAERMEIPKEAGINFLYTGGIDPCVRGADPEFVGKDAVVISDVSDGYWVFYECVEYEGAHPEYFHWFKWANNAIARRHFAAAYEPRQTPETWGIEALQSFVDTDRRILPGVPEESVEFPRTRLRRQNLLFLACKEDQPVQVRLQHIPVSDYQCTMYWKLRDRDMQIVKEGEIDHDSDSVVSFTPDYSGIYVLAASAGRCSFSVASANVPVGLLAGGDGLSVIGAAGPLHFHVPDGVEQFDVSFHGRGSETVRVDIMNPQGTQVATAQTTPEDDEKTLVVPVDADDDAVWSLHIGKADEGVLEDSWLTLDPQLPPVLSPVKEQVFRLKSAE